MKPLRELRPLAFSVKGRVGPQQVRQAQFHLSLQRAKTTLTACLLTTNGAEASARARTLPIASGQIHLTIQPTLRVDTVQRPVLNIPGNRGIY